MILKKLFNYFKHKFDFGRIREEGIKNNIFTYFFDCHPYYNENEKTFTEFMTSLGYKANDEVEFLDFIKRYDERENEGRKVYIDCCSYWVEIYNKETAENPNYITKIKLEKAE